MNQTRTKMQQLVFPLVQMNPTTGVKAPWDSICEIAQLHNCVCCNKNSNLITDENFLSSAL